MTPGLLLRQARQAAGLSVEAVAAHLHLLRSVVNSIEEDSYDRVRGETFLRGYLRNYARLVKLPPDQVLTCYDFRKRAAMEPRPTGNGSNVRAGTVDYPAQRIRSPIKFGLGNGFSVLARRIGL